MTTATTHAERNGVVGGTTQEMFIPPSAWLGSACGIFLWVLCDVPAGAFIIMFIRLTCTSISLLSRPLALAVLCCEFHRSMALYHCFIISATTIYRMGQQHQVAHGISTIVVVVVVHMTLRFLLTRIPHAAQQIRTKNVHPFTYPPPR